MASNTGKKGKKSKEKKLSLQDFLATSTPASGGGTTQVAVSKVSSWAEECEDDEDHKKIEFISLPTAPRAARILEDSSIPQNGPFYARVANLPFDINEGDLDEFFQDNQIQVKEMKLARDDVNDRLRGFGVVEFETREDLIEAVMLSDPTIRNRRIRLEVTTESDSFSGRTVRKRYDNYGSRDGGDTNTNWRDRKESNFEAVDGNDRGGRDRGERRPYQQRSTFQNRHDNNGSSSNGGDDMNWRLGERPVSDSPPPERRRFGNNDRRDGDRRDGDRREGGGRGGGERRYGNDRREQRDSLPEERPKLNIAKRTLPPPELIFPKEEELERGTRKISLNGDKESHDDSGLPDEAPSTEEKVKAPKAKPVPKEDIFGQAKPVDTAAREKEIEEKLERERDEKMRVDKEKREKEREVPSENEERKDVIQIQTESSRRRDETNWRKRDEPATNGGSTDNKTRHMGGSGGGNNNNSRQIGRNDSRPFNKDNRDNRDNRSFNNNRSMNRDRRDERPRDDRRDGGRNFGNQRRDNYNSGSDMRRGDDNIRRENWEPREPIRRDMPKLNEDTGPNLQVSNAFAGLDEEVDAD